MDGKRINYMVSAMCPVMINEKVIAAKKNFALYKAQEKADPNNVILMNEAHVTLKRLFYLKKGVEAQMLVKVLDDIRYAPITITAKEVAVFHSFKVSNVIVAVVDKSVALQQLHDEIYDRLSPFIQTNDRFERSAFTPHISLLYKVPNDILQSAQAYVQERLLPLTYTLNTFSLVKSIPSIQRERSVIKQFQATGVMENTLVIED
jgi:2'-5' RNA ligase